MSEKIVIVGGGVGALASAVRLLHKGYNVHIVERNHQLGGKVGRFTEDGYRFDLTATLLMMPEVYKRLFKDIGKDYRDYIEFHPIDPNFKVFSYDGSSFAFPRELDETVMRLEQLSPELSKGYLEFISQTYSRYLMVNKDFLNHSFTVQEEFCTLKKLRRAAKLKSYQTVEEYISQYIRDEDLKQFLCFQAMHLGISPFEGPSIYALIPAITQIYGVWYLKGGMYSFVQALEKLIREMGGIIELGEEVQEVIVTTDQAIGVKLKDRIILADKVLCNADYPYAMEDLIPEGRKEQCFQGKTAEDMEYSTSSCVVYLGLDKQYGNLEVHNIYLNRHFAQGITGPSKGKIPKNPSLYIYCPTRIEPKMAPYGHEVIQVVWRVPNLLHQSVDWQGKMKQKLVKRTIEILQTISGLEDIGQHLKFIQCLTPDDLEKDFHSYGGAAYGLEPTLKHTGYLRPAVQSPTIRNLYFVGASVQPGAGVSTVLTSSELAVKAITGEFC